tara:strand:- start:64 stop:999 length:936 start_codon:yes stop_codon:yes gene_type:complete
MADSPLSQRQLIGNLPSYLERRPLTKKQQEFVQQVEEEQDPGGILRSRFERPAMSMPTPAPAGLMATPQVQEPNEESSMIDMDSIKSYLGNLFSPSAVSPTAIEEPVSRTEVKTRPHPEPEPDGGVAAEPSFDDALIHTIKYYEGAPILKARKPVKGDPYTIGYGRTRDLEGKPITKNTRITEEQADQMLREDLDTRLQEIKKAYPNFDTYPQELQLQLTQSYYRGTLTPKASPKTRRLINKGKFQEAAKEFLNNEEYKNAKKLGRPGIIERMDDVALALKNMGDDPVQLAKRSTGGRMASNPNPYEPKAI